MRQRLLIITLTLVATLSIYAQRTQLRQEAKGQPLPGTPAGQQMAEWLRVFNAGNSDNLRRFISENYPHSALSIISIDDRTAKDAGLYVRTQGLDLRRIEKSESYVIVVLAQERLDEGWVRINIGVESATPHRIVDFGIRRIPRPADAGAPKKLTESEVLKDID